MLILLIPIANTPITTMSNEEGISVYNYKAKAKDNFCYIYTSIIQLEHMLPITWSFNSTLSYWSLHLCDVIFLLLSLKICLNCKQLIFRSMSFKFNSTSHPENSFFVSEFLCESTILSLEIGDEFWSPYNFAFQSIFDQDEFW